MIRRAHKADPAKRSLARKHFGPLIDELTIDCLDVGSRSGSTEDIAPLAEACNVTGFEPDQIECDRLNSAVAASRSNWKSVRHLPIALSDHAGEKLLNVYSQRGCSSLLEADLQVAEQFGRASYFQLEAQEHVNVDRLDQITKSHNINPVHYIKIDVQGGELDVFKGATETLKECLCIRTEVGFLPLYKNQPLFGDIAGFLQDFGLYPTSFLEVHDWRRETRQKPRRITHGPFPTSKGEIVHGDVLFLRRPETLRQRNADAAQDLLRLGLLALCYDHIDFLASILRNKNVHNWASDRLGSSALDALSKYSKSLVKSRRSFLPRTLFRRF